MVIYSGKKDGSEKCVCVWGGGGSALEAGVSCNLKKGNEIRMKTMVKMKKKKKL